MASGPATVVISGPGGTPTTNAFPITISSTPVAPILNSVLSACTGTPISSVTSGGQFSIEAQGIDTSGAEVVWTPVSGGAITQSLPTSSGGPTGAVCLTGSAPALTAGTWTVRVRTEVNTVFSGLSNGIAVTVP